MLPVPETGYKAVYAATECGCGDVEMWRVRDWKRQRNRKSRAMHGKMASVPSMNVRGGMPSWIGKEFISLQPRV